MAGSDFSINVTSTLDSNDNDPGRNSDNIQEVTQASFQSVTYTVENGPDGRYAWGESFTEGTAERIATNDGSGSKKAQKNHLVPKNMVRILKSNVQYHKVFSKRSRGSNNWHMAATTRK